MISDQEFHTLTHTIRPIAAELRVKLMELESGKSFFKIMPSIQGLMQQLGPFAEERAWLQEYLSSVQEAVAPYLATYLKYRRNLWIHIGILMFLALVPVATAIAGMPPMVIVLLVLPVIGWYVIGIRGYQRRFRPQMG